MVVHGDGLAQMVVHRRLRVVNCWKMNLEGRDLRQVVPFRSSLLHTVSDVEAELLGLVIGKLEIQVSAQGYCLLVGVETCFLGISAVASGLS